MLDEDRLEGWSVARHLMVKHLEVPLSQESFQLKLEIGSERPWCA